LFRLLLILLVAGIAYYLLLSPLKRWLASLSGPAKKLLAAAVLLFILLVAGGGFNVLTGLVIGLLAVLPRILPVILRYLPQLESLLRVVLKTRQEGGAQHRTQHNYGSANSSKTMSEAEAYEVLGLQPTAGEKEIIDAHRRLMQKNHPDRGGSDYLAAKINLAKKILLKR